MYDVVATNQFSKDYKRCIKRAYDIILLDDLIIMLSEIGTVPLTQTSPTFRKFKWIH